MGIAITLIAAMAMALIAIVARPIVAYVLLFLLIFFTEKGAGFSSFNASFVFNQNFTNFLNFQFFEILLVAAYAGVIFSTNLPPYKFFKFEKWLSYLFVSLIVSLLFVEYFSIGTVTVADWRVLVSGFILFHLLAMLINTEEKLVSFCKVLLIMLSCRAAIGLAFYFAGYGILSPRGRVPFFWDSRQVDAFAFAIIILTTYIANFRSLLKTHVIFPRFVALVMLAILTLTVLLSIRRTVWFIALLGIMMALLLSKRIKLPHLIGISFAVFMGLTVALFMPQLKNFRAHINQYIQSVNLFDTEEAQKQENQVHVNNVIQYTKMISENHGIFWFGLHSKDGNNFSKLRQQYTQNYDKLGLAHNAILRTIHFFGIGGLVIYMFFYIGCLLQYRKIAMIPEEYIVKHIGIASFIFLFLEFTSSLTFVPPFYTTIKGLFYTFLAVFFVRSAIGYHGTTTSAFATGKR